MLTDNTAGRRLGKSWGRIQKDLETIQRGTEGLDDVMVPCVGHVEFRSLAASEADRGDAGDGHAAVLKQILEAHA